MGEYINSIFFKEFDFEFFNKHNNFKYPTKKDAFNFIINNNQLDEIKIYDQNKELEEKLKKLINLKKKFDHEYYYNTYKFSNHWKDNKLRLWTHYINHGFLKGHKCYQENEFKINTQLKDYIITLLGYKKIKEDGSRHTNWFPWNRFKHVYETIGYKCEWLSLEELERKNEKRLFITWNEPTSLELYQSGKINNNDIVFQKLTSLGKGMNDVNWTENPKKWCEEWAWPIYKNIEYLYDLGVNIYGFGCKTEIDSFPEKKRICEKLKDRIHWITWGGTPFSWEQIKNCKPVIDNLNEDISFVGSKWGKDGRGNVDAWEKYIEPFEKDNCKYKFNQYGGIENKMVSDDEMIKILQKSKLCPIIHAPSWQAERGVQDRFYTVFLSGRFGICDNLGAIDIFGDEIKDICTEDPDEYHKKSIYYLKHPEEQIKHIKLIQNKIKEKYNFYREWESILLKIKIIKFTTISVICPFYNESVDIIKNKINNFILESKNLDIKLILINDNVYRNEVDNLVNEDNVHIIHMKNNYERIHCRNYGAKICNSKYIIFNDIDDIVPKKSYHNLYNYIKNNNLDVCYGNCLVSKNKEINEWNIPDKIEYPSKHFFHLCSMIISTELFNKVKFVDYFGRNIHNRIYAGEDVNFMFRLLAHKKILYNCNNYTYMYFFGMGTSHKDRTLSRLELFKNILMTKTHITNEILTYFLNMYLQENKYGTHYTTNDFLSMIKIENNSISIKKEYTNCEIDYLNLFNFINAFDVNFAYDLSINNLSKTADKLVHFGWEKEAIPITQSKKTLIARFFDKIFN